MKKNIIILAIITIAISVNAQTHWTKKSDYFKKHYKVVAFNIEDKGYAGLGIDSTNNKIRSFWQYDPNLNVWNRQADHPSDIYGNNNFGFSLLGKGYVRAGSISQPNDFWQFSPFENKWTPKGLVGDNPHSTFVTIKSNVYLLEADGTSCYNPDSNTWTSKALFPGLQRSAGVAFAIGNKGYYGMGFNSGPFSDFWEYNPTTNTWRELDKYTLNTTGSGIGFSMNGKGYIAAGSDFFYEYNPGFNAWKKLDSIPVKGSVGFAFSVNNKAYVYLNNTNQDNFWEYDPKEVRLQAITTTKQNCLVDSITLQYQIVPYKNHTITAQLAAEGTQFANPIILTTFTDSTGIANKKIALPSGLNTNQVYEIRLISNFGDTSSTEKLVLNLYPRKLIISKVKIPN